MSDDTVTRYFFSCSCGTQTWMEDAIRVDDGDHGRLLCPYCATTLYLWFDEGTIDLGLVTDEKLEAAYQADPLRHLR